MNQNFWLTMISCQCRFSSAISLQLLNVRVQFTHVDPPPTTTSTARNQGLSKCSINGTESSSCLSLLQDSGNKW